MIQEDEKEERTDATIDEATSSETLSDVEENENVSEEPDDSGSSVPLSPDGDVNSDNSERSPEDDFGPI
jgi:hypothetical protein